jgi:hypothetical protein
VQLQNVAAEYGSIRFLFLKGDQLHFVEAVKPDDSFSSINIIFRSFKVGDSGVISTKHSDKDGYPNFRFDANVTHCIPLDHTFNQFIISCSDCTVHVVDISIKRIMRSITIPSNAESVSHHPHSSLTVIVMGNGDLVLLDRGLNFIPISIGTIDAEQHKNVPLGVWLSRSSLGSGKPTIMRWGRLMECSDSSSLFICYEMGHAVMVKLEYSFFMGNLKTSSMLSHYIETHDLEKVTLSTINSTFQKKTLFLGFQYHIYNAWAKLY